MDASANTYSYIHTHLNTSQAKPFIEFLVNDTKTVASQCNGQVDMDSLLDVLTTRDSFIREMFRKYVLQVLKREERYAFILSFPLSESEEKELIAFVKPRLRKHLNLSPSK